eukprot:TRINITY_DN3560_c0_g1_i1.p1 TRINITY_DN3560_c0_g1~~TRINITY_DN3560_c0_g1_i1.p1  ORF type:complete len:122 (+),score=3.60 TRINITY_DN3560_c0_g1_i1:265-630(+)
MNRPRPVLVEMAESAELEAKAGMVKAELSDLLEDWADALSPPEKASWEERGLRLKAERARARHKAKRAPAPPRSPTARQQAYRANKWASQTQPPRTPVTAPMKAPRAFPSGMTPDGKKRKQ